MDPASDNTQYVNQGERIVIGGLGQGYPPSPPSASTYIPPPAIFLETSAGRTGWIPSGCYECYVSDFGEVEGLAVLDRSPRVEFPLACPVHSDFFPGLSSDLLSLSLPVLLSDPKRTEKKQEKKMPTPMESRLRIKALHSRWSGVMRRISGRLTRVFGSRPTISDYRGSAVFFSSLRGLTVGFVRR